MCLKCKQCGGAIRPNMDKLKVIGKGMAVAGIVGFLTGTPTGWLALLTSAASPNVRAMIMYKMAMMKESAKVGSHYFECGLCWRSISLGELFG